MHDARPVGAVEGEDERGGRGGIPGSYPGLDRCVNRDTYCDTQHRCATVGLCRPAPARLPRPSRPVGRPGTDHPEILARLGEAGVTEIAGELGVHKSTAFRLVATLESHGMVEQNEDRGKYRLGVGVLRLAGATTARLDVVQEARPICRKLAADSGETVNIAVLSDRSALYLDQVAGTPRSSRTTGSASTSRCTPPPTARCCCPACTTRKSTRMPRLPSLHRHDDLQGPAASASSTRCATRATRSRSTCSRSG